MMRNWYKKYITLTIAITLLFTVAPTYSQQEISNACIAYKNNAVGLDKKLCKSYIRGFLDGALLTDTAIIDNFVNEKSSFFQRAYQTRAVKDRKPLPATYLAKFCLPESEALPNIVDDVIKNLDKSSLESKSLNHVIYETIKRIYPCEK